MKTITKHNNPHLVKFAGNEPFTITFRSSGSRYRIDPKNNILSDSEKNEWKIIGVSLTGFTIKFNKLDSNKTYSFDLIMV